MARPRRQVFTLDMYLQKMKDLDIRSDQDVQRLSGAWNKEMMNQLIATVLTDNYIPPIILGEERNCQLWIIDGLQRSSSLMLFRYGKYKITSNLEEPVVTYRAKARDEKGNVVIDESGDIVWNIIEYDIRNKTYDKLPEELKKKFCEYQIETVIHENYEMNQISKLVRIYNNHTSMNASQKAFTFLDNFGREIRSITKNRFFLDLYAGSIKDKTNGKFEKMAGNMILLCNYPDQYKKNMRLSFKWLNENACLYDFESMNDLLTRLTLSLDATPEMKGLFNAKHTCIFVALFKSFIESGRADKEFNDFLNWFICGGKEIVIDEKAWVDWDTSKSTTDTTVVHKKLNYLTALIERYAEESKTKRAA